MNDPSDLTAELVKLRQLTVEAEGSPALQRSLIDSTRACAEAYDKQQIRNGKMLSKDAVARIGHEFMALVMEEVGGLPGGEEAVDRVLARLPRLIAAQKNRPDEIRAAIGRETR